MTRGENFMEKRKCKNNHCSAMSNSAWCDLNSKGGLLQLHDRCPNNKCNCQKQTTFTPHQDMLEGGLIKSKLQKSFRGTETAWNKFLKPAVNVAAPFIGVAVAAKSKNPKVGAATSKILKSISEGKILSPTDMHGNGLRLKVI